MAEKGILVNDQAGGESIATRDAVQTDDDTNARVVQLIDKAARPIAYKAMDALTPTRQLISVGESGAGDSLQLTSPLSTTITDDKLDVSDAESFVMQVVVTRPNTGSDGTLTITPLILDDAGVDVAAVLPPTKFAPVAPVTTGATDTYFLRIETDGESLFPTIPAVYPTLGAKYVAFHVRTSNIQQVDIFAYPTSCAGRNSALDDNVDAGNHGTIFPISSASGS